MTIPDTPRFAALGHQDDWDKIAAIVRALRPADARPLTRADIGDVIRWIPSRTVSRFRVGGRAGSPAIAGVYIDTFIPPDELAPGRATISKVRDGIVAARREGAPIVTLGGFTSILLEAAGAAPVDGIAVTTGNTLTAALILKGVERALFLLGRRLEDEDVLVIGATGDVGSACARALAGRTRRLLLCARNVARLEREASRLRAEADVAWSDEPAEMLRRASVVVAAASTPQETFDLAECRPDTIVCDAGYPKNIRPRADGPRIFFGGMGRLAGGLWSDDGMLERFYDFPVADVAHGCMIEGAVLAMAGRHESFSTGRGHITRGRIDEIWALAGQHGVAPAPLFDASGIWPEERSVCTAPAPSVQPLGRGE